MVTVRSPLLFSIAAFLLLTVAVPVSGQLSGENTRDIVFLRSSPVFSNDDSTARCRIPLLPDTATSEARILSHFMIRLYQNYVSSQQHDVCVFTPSCSHFGMEAVDRCGFIRGVLLTADRLTRCNTFVSKGGYPFDPATGRFIDSVAAYCRDSTTPVPCRPLRKGAFP